MPGRPLRRAVREQPVRSYRSQHIKRVAQRLTHRLQAIHRPRHGEHMGGVGPLAPARSEQLPYPEVIQERLEQQQLRRPGDEAGAEFREDRGVEAGIVHLLTQQILPVDAAAHGIGGLPVREPFHELQEEHHRQPPRSQRGLTTARKQRGELLVLEERTALVPHGQVGMAMGNAARATRAVSSGTAGTGLGCRHIGVLLPESGIRHGRTSPNHVP